MANWLVVVIPQVGSTRLLDLEKGIATPKHEVDRIKQRYKEAKELAAHEEDEESGP